jgi:hypothetical protein
MVALNADVFDAAMRVHCHVCDAEYAIFLKYSDYFAWKNREGFIQDLIPYLSDAERELLISNTCGYCFDKMFEPLDNDD